ncbi:MAG: GIY-YIG nuclease family protein, partial [Bacilli bacterium]|nr:GIY-YIG nuclease family protein [Bacilli bacterium]
MIKDKLSLTPNKPGCYLMKNFDGNIIYVGKAKKLKNRLSSYFRGKHTGKTKKLVSEIVDFEYIVVGSETEALILELNLIKKHNPKYNILLRDDKTYPYIELTNEPVPRLMIVRNINRKKTNTNRMYGPYPNVYAARKTVDLLNRLYPLRKCRTYPKKPCLYYHINQCLGYCVYKIDEKIIKEMEQEIIQFLKGDSSLVTNKIKEEMILESDKMNYEKAKELKELLD